MRRSGTHTCDSCKREYTLLLTWHDTILEADSAGSGGHTTERRTGERTPVRR
jgi:hypothetical protein